MASGVACSRPVTALSTSWRAGVIRYPLARSSLVRSTSWSVLPTLRVYGRGALSDDSLELGGEVVLQFLAHRGHVEGPVQVALDQSVEPVAAGVFLGGGGARDG